MQKKKDEICGFKLFVLIMFKATNEPNKYEPLSPKNILAFGKLNSKKDNKTTIWAIIITARFSWLLFKLMKKSIKFIRSKWIVKRPLNPSIKFAPFTINKKHKRTKAVENILLFIHVFKNFKSTDSILIEKKAIKNTSSDETKTREIVQNLLTELEKTKEEGCKELTKKFDKYEGEIIVSKEKIEEKKKKIYKKTKNDIQFCNHREIKFSEPQ